MNLPQEIELWHVIPLIRKLLALDMKRQGLSQKDIAFRLGISPSAISQYLKKKRAKDFGVEISPKIEQEIHESAKRIIKNPKRTEKQVIREINKLCALFRKEGITCQIGRKHNPDLKDCKVCYE